MRLGQERPEGPADRRGVHPAEGKKRIASSPVAPRRSGERGSRARPGGEREHPGAWPEHSPNSEEKEAEVSMALWKFSSIFRPSSMFRPGREDLRRGNDAPGVRALWVAAAALLGEAGGSVQGDQNEPEDRGQPRGTWGGRRDESGELLRLI